MHNPLTPVANVIRDAYTKLETQAVITRAIGGDPDFISRGQYDYLAQLDNHPAEPICKENFIAGNGESVERALTELLSDAWMKVVDAVNTLDMVEQFKNNPHVGELQEGAHDKLIMARNVIEQNIANYRTIFAAQDSPELDDFLAGVEKDILEPLKKFIEDNDLELSPNHDYSTFEFLEAVDPEKWETQAQVTKYVPPTPES